MQNTHGDYVVDIPYTWEFFDVQNPAYLSYLCHSRGIKTPLTTDDFTYCELGCGNGLTSNLLAAALPQGQFYAVDFNPEHIANAETIAEAGQLNNINFLCCDFEALLRKDDVPAMDFITLHGVYSWVSQDIRNQVLQIIHKYLKPGGLLYVSYNPLPKWSEITPMWRIMLEHIRPMQTDSVSKAEEGLRYLSHLRENGLQYLRTHPGASHFLDELLARDIRFVAHEFCNNYLEPQYFIDVANAMSGIGLEYCCNADFEDSEVFIPGELLDYVGGDVGKVAKESRRSLLSNEFFRRDIYIKGDGRDAQDKDACLSLMGDWILGSQYSDFQIQRAFPAYKNDVRFQDTIYEAIMVTAYQGQLNLTELCTHENLNGYSPDNIIDAVHALVKAEQLDVLVSKAAKPYAIDDDPIKTFTLVHPVNRYLLDNRLLQDAQCYLVSPVLGSALPLDLITGLCLMALLDDANNNAVDFIREKLKYAAGNYPEGDDRLPNPAKLADREWLEEQWHEFKMNILPVLLRYKILH